MQTSFAQLIAKARVRQGLDQGGLAKRLAVTQQTVSRWETGEARPRTKAKMAELVAVLELQTREVSQALADDSRSKANAAAPERVEATQIQMAANRPLVTVLPFEVLTFDQFEQLVATLYKRQDPDSHVERLGGTGDDQKGYDIRVVRADGLRVGIQCKRVSQFGPAKVASAVAAAELAVDQSVIALSRPATSEARFEMDNHPGWTLLDQDDLSRAIKALPLEQALEVVGTYFPAMRESFLGVDAPGPWQTPDQFFRLTPTTLLDHRQALAGRQDLVDAISNWSVDGRSPIGVLTGRGALGKSKLLYEVALNAKREGVEFRFLGVGQRPTAASFDSLPREGKLVVVIDDAHNVDDVVAIANQLFHERQSARLLLATRPVNEARLDADFWRLNEVKDPDSQWSLTDLTPDEATKLVTELIGSSATDAITKQLVAVSADMPLIAVVAAKLLKDGQLGGRTFASSAALRREVLSRFTHGAISHGTATETEERRSLLAAIAAFQPVRMGDPDFQNALSAMTHIESWDLVSRRIRELEDAGLVLRRGESVRVVPDMLGDILLGQASYDERSGLTTKYLDRALVVAKGTSLQHLLVNASRMDWQVRDGGPTRSDMVSGLWETLRAAFVDAGYADQIQMMKLVEKIAFYQPTRALELVREVLALEPTSDELAATAAERSWMTFTRPDVIRALPAVIRNIAYNLDYLPACLDLLWELAQNDRRPTNQFPEHPLRLLQEIADLRRDKPFDYNNAVIEAANRWFSQPYAAGLSPFDVLESMLATEGREETSSHLSVTIYSFGIDPKSVRDVRSKVVDIAYREARSDDPVVAVRAINALENAIRYPLGVNPTEPQMESWTEEFLPIIKALGVIGSEPQHDPGVRIAIRQALGWLADVDRSPAKAKRVAKAAIAKLGSTLEDDVALCLHGGWGRMALRGGLSYEDSEKKRIANFKTVAGQLASSQTEDEVLEILERRLVVERVALKSAGNAGQFLWELFETRPDVAARLCERFLDGDFEELRSYTDLALSVLATVNDDRAMGFASRMAASPLIEVQQTVASALSWRRVTRPHMLDGEFELMAAMAQHPDEIMRRGMGHAIFALSRTDPAVALDLLALIRFDGSAKVAEEALRAFILQGPLEWSKTDRSLRQSILDQLVDCSSIDEYEIMSAVAKLSAIDPMRVVKFFIARVDRQIDARVEGSMTGYDAIPHHWDPALTVYETPQLDKCLRAIKDWMAADTRDKAYRYEDDGARLYSMVAGKWDEQALAPLAAVAELSAKPDTLSAIVATARILGQAPSSVRITNESLVTEILHRAEKLGPEAAKLVLAVLGGAYTVTIRGGWGNQADPADLNQRDRAQEIVSRLPRGSIEAKFYQSLADEAEAYIQMSTRDRDLPYDGRDW